MDTLREIAEIVLTPLAIVAAIAWVLRSAITHYLSRDIDRFKDKLAIAAKERELVFTVLQPKRAEVIGELYERIIDFMAAAERCVSPMGYESDPPKKVQLQEVSKTEAELFRYFLKHRIYLSKSVCEGVEVLRKTLMPDVRRFGIRLAFEERYPNLESGSTEAWDKAWDTLQEQVPPIMETIEAEFRELLGVEPKAAKP